MKMKEFGPPGGARVPGAPPWIRQCEWVPKVKKDIGGSKGAAGTCPLPLSWSNFFHFKQFMGGGGGVGNWPNQWRIYIVKFWTCAPPGGPNSFNFMQFLGTFGKIVCWRPPGELAPPPRGDKNSATANNSLLATPSLELPPLWEILDPLLNKETFLS